MYSQATELIKVLWICFCTYRYFLPEQTSAIAICHQWVSNPCIQYNSIEYEVLYIHYIRPIYCVYCALIHKTWSDTGKYTLSEQATVIDMQQLGIKAMYTVL